jgi:hypothetical protein
VYETARFHEKEPLTRKQTVSIPLKSKGMDTV